MHTAIAMSGSCFCFSTRFFKYYFIFFIVLVWLELVCTFPRLTMSMLIQLGGGEWG